MMHVNILYIYIHFITTSMSPVESNPPAPRLVPPWHCYLSCGDRWPPADGSRMLLPWVTMCYHGEQMRIASICKASWRQNRWKSGEWGWNLFYEKPRPELSPCHRMTPCNQAIAHQLELVYAVPLDSWQVPTRNMSPAQIREAVWGAYELF